MQTYYISWAAEEIFEFVWKKEFASLPSRLTGSYYFDNIANCRALYEIDWGKTFEETLLKIHLFEIELCNEHPAKFDMRLFDKAYDSLWDNEGVFEVMAFARRYFLGDMFKDPVMKILSEKPAKTVKNISTINSEDNIFDVLPSALSFSKKWKFFLCNNYAPKSIISGRCCLYYKESEAVIGF